MLDTVTGTEAQRFPNQHTARVNDLSLDARGEFVASCADDGKVRHGVGIYG